MKKKKVCWHRARHNFWWHVMRSLVNVYCRIKYRFKTQKFDNRKRPYLCLYNHQTAIDGIMLNIALKKMAYLVCTEDLYTMGSTTKFLHYAVAPIAFKKSMSDPSAVMNCLRVSREGYSIALSPEGNRTFTGETGHIKPAIAKMIKTFNMPVLVYMLSGGYDVSPRYVDKPRKGAKIVGKFTAKLEPEEFKDMTVEQVYDWLVKAMYVDESDTGVKIKSKRRAEYMERTLYYCPVCGATSSLKSHKNTVTCLACGTNAEVDEYKRFKPPFPVRTVKEWVDKQDEFIRGLDLDKYIDVPFSVDTVDLRELLRKQSKKQTLLEGATVKLFGDRFEVGEYVFKFSDMTAAAMCGRNRVDFYVGDRTFQIRSKTPICIRKFVNFLYHYKNVKEDGDGFLGI